MAEVGFIFWGIFLIFFLIILGYAVWMWYTERKK